MASDLNNTSGSLTGNQNLGDAIVRFGPKGGAYKVKTTYRHTIAIDDIDDKWTDRWDDPRYYTGDTAS